MMHHASRKTQDVTKTFRNSEIKYVPVFSLELIIFIHYNISALNLSCLETPFKTGGGRNGCKRWSAW